MSTYNKTIWQDGDIITADKMNNIENGIYSYNEDITKVDDTFDQLFGGKIETTPDFTTVDNKYIGNDGTPNPNEGWFYCNYVDISQAFNHKVKVTTTIYQNNPSTAWYDSNHGLLGYISGRNASEYGVTASYHPQTIELTLPSDAVYIRSSGFKQYFDPADMVISYEIQSGGEFYDELNKKIDIEQNSSDAGKALIIGADGMVMPDTIPAPPELDPIPLNITGLLLKTDEISAGIQLNVTTEATAVMRAGKNIFMYSASSSGYAGGANVDAFDSTDQTFKMTVKSGGSAYIVRTSFIPVSVGDKITISTECLNQYGNPATPVLRTYDSAFAVMSTGSNGTYNSTYKGFLGDTIGGSFTYEITSADVTYVCFGFSLRAANGVSIGQTVLTRCQAEVGSYATEWTKSVSLQKTPTGGSTWFESLNGINTLFATRPITLTVTADIPSYSKSVNGRTGAVILSAEDIGALPDGFDGYNDIIHRNEDMWQAVNACARYGHSSGSTWNVDKQFTMMITTDLHHDIQRLKNAIDYMNWSKVIDCGFCLGDMQMNNFSDDDGTWLTNMINASDKKIYPLIGNHDAGMGTAIATVGSKEQQFNKFFAPVLTKLGLTGLTKTYYSLTEGNLSIICLDCYDVPDTLADASNYAFHHGSCCYSQDQIDWFVQTLSSIPANNHLVIMVHDTPEVKTVEDCAWSDTTYTDTDYPFSGMIPEIVNAWMTGTALNKTYNPTFMSTLGTRTVNADFTSRGVGIFAGYIHGHRHRDFIQKITAYPNQNAISLAGTLLDVSGNANSDLPRIINTRSEDAVTVVTVDTISRLIKLVRIGSNVTFNMKKRDIYAVSY